MVGVWALRCKAMPSAPRAIRQQYTATKGRLVEIWYGAPHKTGHRKGMRRTLENIGVRGCRLDVIQWTIHRTAIAYAGEQYCWPPVAAQTWTASRPVTPAGTATLTCCTPGAVGASPA